MDTDSGRGGGQPPGSVMDFRPQDPGGGEVRLNSSRDETVALPVANAGCGGGGAVRVDAERPVPRTAGSRSTRQPVGLHSGDVKVSTVSLNVTRK